MAKRKNVRVSSRISYAKLDAVKLGFAGGIVLGVSVLLTTLGGVYGVLGGFPMWTQLIADCYGALGYNVSWTGAILGLIYGFIDGFVVMGVLAWIYNKLR